MHQDANTSSNLATETIVTHDLVFCARIIVRSAAILFGSDRQGLPWLVAPETPLYPWQRQRPGPVTWLAPVSTQKPSLPFAAKGSFRVGGAGICMGGWIGPLSARLLGSASGYCSVPSGVIL